MESELLTSSSTRLQQWAEPLGSPVSGVSLSFGPNLFCATFTARLSYSSREKPTVWLLHLQTVEDQNCHHSDH